MNGPPINLGTNAAGLDRRSRWLVWFTDRMLRQDLTAEDRVAILTAMLGREVAQFPQENWGAIGTLIGQVMGSACQGAHDAKAVASLALAMPAGRA